VAKAFDEVVVTAVHVLESRDRRLAFGDETGEDQRGCGTDVMACTEVPVK